MLTPEHLLMLQGALAPLILALPTLFTLIFPHPTEVQGRVCRALLAFLGRYLSLAEHVARLHLPGAAQPAPVPAPPVVTRRCPGCGCGPIGGRIAHEPGCGCIGYVCTVDGIHLYADAQAAERGRRAAADTIPDFPPPALPSMVTSPRISSVAAMLLGLGLVLSSACTRDTLDAARVQYSNALKASTAIQGRFKVMDARFQLDIAQPPRTREEALAALLAYRQKRRIVHDEILRCQGIMDEAAEQLLLSDKQAGINSAAAAQTCAASMRDKVNKLFDGGL